MESMMYVAINEDTELEEGDILIRNGKAQKVTEFEDTGAAIVEDVIEEIVIRPSTQADAQKMAIMEYMKRIINAVIDKTKGET